MRTSRLSSRAGTLRWFGWILRSGLGLLLVSGAAVADVIQCRDFPDGDFQSVQVDNGLL